MTTTNASKATTKKEALMPRYQIPRKARAVNAALVRAGKPPLGELVRHLMSAYQDLSRVAAAINELAPPYSVTGETPVTRHDVRRWLAVEDPTLPNVGPKELLK